MAPPGGDRSARGRVRRNFRARTRPGPFPPAVTLKLRVGLIAAPAAFGGLESVVAGLAVGLQAAGHEVCVGLVVPPGEASPLERGLREASVAVLHLAVPARRYLLERRLVRGLLERHAVTILHTHGYRPDVVDAPVARAMEIPIVSTVHGFIGGSRRGRFYEWLQVRALRRFDRVIAVSRPIASRLEAAGVSRERLRCVPNAWGGGRFLSRNEARAVLGLTGDGPVLGWVGRLSREKGPDLFIAALAALASAGGGRAPLACIVGDGPDAAGLRALAERAGVGDRIRWTGIVADAGRCLPAFDVLALSSRTEGTPMILLEAMAAGVPVVATAVGGVPDVVSPAEAHLVAAEEPAGLAAALWDTLTDPSAARARAGKARERVLGERALAPWIEQHVRLYQELAAR